MFIEKKDETFLDTLAFIQKDVQHAIQNIFFMLSRFCTMNMLNCTKNMHFKYQNNFKIFKRKENLKKENKCVW